MLSQGEKENSLKEDKIEIEYQHMVYYLDLFIQNLREREIFHPVYLFFRWLRWPGGANPEPRVRIIIPISYGGYRGPSTWLSSAASPGISKEQCRMTQNLRQKFLHIVMYLINTFCLYGKNLLPLAIRALHKFPRDFRLIFKTFI